MESHIAAWLARDPDPETRQEIKELLANNDEQGLRERFTGRLEFGTAGLRGLLGAGPARMNRLVVQESTAGLATYLSEQVDSAAARGVVVGFDGRRNSRIFAEDVASILGAAGFRVHLFDREVPTPVAGFAVRHLHAAAGVVITASHNPPAYNGYKVYWANGAQIIPPHDGAIAAAIARAARANLEWQNPAELRRSGMIVSLGEPMEQAYLDGVARLSIHRPSALRGTIGIAYTPLHGVGARLAEASLQRAGFMQVHTVQEQREPNGAFPTVKFPNPEEPGAMDRVVALAEGTGAFLACANDPDADRFAVAARLPQGGYRMLTGNEIGYLLADDLLRRAPKNGVAASTIVSSRLLGRMCRRLNIHYFETLTGFKWIANGALEQTAAGKKMVFAYEEALGYAIGDLVWDKDGISALVAFAEMAAACHEQQTTVWQHLEAIYREYGLFLTAQRTWALSQASNVPIGMLLRKYPPTHVANRAVVATDDLQKNQSSSVVKNYGGLPASDVLIYQLAGDSRVIVRPSGTEPKIKCYYEVFKNIDAHEPFEQAHGRAQQELEEIISGHQTEMTTLIENAKS